MLVYPLLGTIVTSWASTDAKEDFAPLYVNASNEEEETGGPVVPFFVWRRISSAFLVATVLSVVYPAWLYRRKNMDSAHDGGRASANP